MNPGALNRTKPAVMSERIQPAIQQSAVDRWLEACIRWLAMGIARLVYRVRTEGVENLPAEVGVLLICNHVSYADTLPLSMACPRKLRFTSFAGLFSVPVLGACLRIFGCIPVSPDRAKEALQRSAACIRSGECLLLFPEGKLTLDGRLQEIKRGYELIAKLAGCPIIVVQLDGLWGSIFSNSGGRFFFKWPDTWRRDVVVRFSRPFAPEDIRQEEVAALFAAVSLR